LKIQINASKSTAIIFSLRRYFTPLPLKFENVPIPWKPSVKYLGVTLDKRLTWGPHLSTKLQLAYQRLSMLFSIINKKSAIQKKMFNPNIQATSTATNNLCLSSMGEMFGYTP
jgi:hypothetical protein